MVFAEGGSPAISACYELLPFGDDLFHVAQLVGRMVQLLDGTRTQVHHLELEDHVQLLIRLRHISQHMGRIWRVRQLSNRDGAILAKDFLVHFSKKLVHPRPVAVHVKCGLSERIRVDDKSIGQVDSLAVHVHGVDPKAVNALPSLEVHGSVVYCISTLVILPVQIGLLRREKMQIIVTRRFIKGPGRNIEIASPIIWRLKLTVGAFSSWPPDVPISLGVVLARFRFSAPGVLIEGMIDDQI